MFNFRKLNSFVEKSKPLCKIISFRYFQDQKISTIFALSSGFGKCGVAVIRVSGPGVKHALKNLGGFKELPSPRKAELRKIRDPITKELIDHGIVFWFPGPKSFTGEDCCEFQIHGGTAVISALLSGLGKMEGFRPALPGEFTKRAFYSGKLDLPSVEGLGALINSETELQRKHALYQMGGSLSSLYREWARTLTKCLAHLEAHIDFDEDQDIDKDVLKKIEESVDSLISQIKVHLEDGRKGERIRDGVEVAILGPPNSGKSSLLNVLSQREAAIVSRFPGTTRDVVRTHLDLNGYPVNLSDTAGIRYEDVVDEVESEGITRAKDVARTSHVVLLLYDATLLPPSVSFGPHLSEYILNLGLMEEMARCDNLQDILDPDIRRRREKVSSADDTCYGLIVLTKADLLLPSQLTIPGEILTSPYVSLVSSKTEYGIPGLLSKITSCLEILCGRGEAARGFSRPYQRDCLKACLEELVLYRASTSAQVDLASEHLRSALVSLGRLTGEVSPNHLLEVIFTDFCIGK